LGEKVRVLVDEYLQKGEHRLILNAKGLSSGVYFYQLDAAEAVHWRKMILLRQVGFDFVVVNI
jgi:hypothetical protein